MVFKGVKIHASVLKNSVHGHQKKLVEGNVYEICLFWIASSFRLLRTTLHPFRIILHLASKVRSITSNLISEYGLTAISSTKVSTNVFKTRSDRPMQMGTGPGTGLDNHVEPVRNQKNWREQ